MRYTRYVAIFRKPWLARSILIVVTGTMIGAPWAMLQVVAWGRMVKEYSTQWGLTEGLEKTFDGEHPCSMCKAISKARVAETVGDEQVATPSPRTILQALLPAAEAALLIPRPTTLPRGRPGPTLGRPATGPPQPPP